MGQVISINGRKRAASKDLSRQIIDLYTAGYSRDAIASRTTASAKTVANVLSVYREAYPENRVNLPKKWSDELKRQAGKRDMPPNLLASKILDAALQANLIPVLLEEEDWA